MKSVNPLLRSYPLLRHRCRTFITAAVGLLLLVFALCQKDGRVVKADSSIGNVGVGVRPRFVAVNPVTNKVYVANREIGRAHV